MAQKKSRETAGGGGETIKPFQAEEGLARIQAKFREGGGSLLEFVEGQESLSNRVIEALGPAVLLDVILSQGKGTYLDTSYRLLVNAKSRGGLDSVKREAMSLQRVTQADPSGRRLKDLLDTLVERKE